MPDPIVFELLGEAASAQRALDKVEAELLGVAKAQGTVNAATAAASSTTTAATRATTAATKSAVDYRQTIAQLAQGFGMLNPKIGQVAGSLVGLTSAFGPVGIAVTGLTVALPILVDALGDQEDATDRATDATNRYGAALERTRTLVEQASGAYREQAALLGRGGVQEQIAAAEVAHNRLLRARTELARGALRGSGGVIEELASTNEQLRQSTERLADLRQQLLGEIEGSPQQIASANAAAEADKQKQNAGRGSTARRRRGGAANDNGADLARLMEAAAREEREMEQALADQIIGIKTKQHEEEMRLLQERRDFEESERQLAAEGAERLADIQIEQLARVTAQSNANAEAMAATEARLAQERKDTTLGFLGVADQAGQGLLDMFAATEGQKELWAGGIQIAEAIGSYPDPVGIASHALSAGLHFANAAQMGVGGGGSAQAQLPAAGAAGTAAARPAQSDTAAGGGGGNVTYNINQPLTEAQLGRLNQRHDRASNRRFGRIAA